MNAARTIPIRRQTPPPPAHLKSAGVAHWERVVTRVRLDDDELTVLQAACEMLDRAAAFRADIEARGEVVADRFGIQKPNQSADFERRALDAFRALNRELGLSMADTETRAPLAKGYR